jgi:hypothetical protein
VLLKGLPDLKHRSCMIEYVLPGGPHSQESSYGHS